MTQTTTLSWMWLGGDNVAGVSLDKERRTLRWQTEIGCHCAGDDALVQTAVAYREQGAPGGVPQPPADIVAEIDSALKQLAA